MFNNPIESTINSFFLLRQGKTNGDGASSSSAAAAPSMPTKVWQPGVDKLEEGEELQCDPSAYNSLHAFHIGWPCLRCWEILNWFLVLNLGGVGDGKKVCEISKV